MGFHLKSSELPNRNVKTHAFCFIIQITNIKSLQITFIFSVGDETVNGKFCHSCVSLENLATLNMTTTSFPYDGKKKTNTWTIH